MIKLIDLVETKVTPKVKKEFHVEEKTDDHMGGNLTIGNNNYWAYIFYEEDTVINIPVSHEYHGENIGYEIENNFKKHNIKYEEDIDDEISYYFIPIKENNIKIINNVSETKIAPRKPFILFRSVNTFNQWVDESYHFFKNNDPKQNTIWVFSKDEIEKSDLLLQFTKTSINIGNITYLDKKIKNLPGAKIEEETIHLTKYFFSIPTKYFEIQDYPQQ